MADFVFYLIVQVACQRFALPALGAGGGTPSDWENV